MSGIRARLLALALGCALALAVLHLWRDLSERIPRQRYEAGQRIAHQRVEEHARGITHRSLRVSEDADDIPPEARARRWFIGREDEEALYQHDHSLETYDPWCYFRHVPNLDLTVKWPEHPRGEWRYVTNSLGLREDQELLVEKPDLFVLVTGDSHTDGFCDNRDSFAHLLQSGLAAAHPHEVIEVLNAANGGYSFHNYLGVLERFLHLLPESLPDVFVVGVFGGNDFHGVVIPHGWFHGIPLPRDTPEERDEVARGKRLGSASLPQSYQSILYFRWHPEMMSFSIDASVEVMSEIQSLCDAHGIHLVCVYIPPPHEMPWVGKAVIYEKLARELNLSPGDLSISTRLADLFLSEMCAHGIATIDARELFAPRYGPYFWNRDQHINLAAHRVIALALQREIEGARRLSR